MTCSTNWERKLEHPPRVIKQEQLLNFIFEPLPEDHVPLILRHGRVLPVFLTKSSGFGLLQPWRSPITYPFPSSQVLLSILLLVQLRPFQTLSVQTLAKVCGRREMYGQSTPSGSLPFSSCKESSASFLPWHSLASHQTHWCLHHLRNSKCSFLSGSRLDQGSLCSLYSSFPSLAPR